MIAATSNSTEVAVITVTQVRLSIPTLTQRERFKTLWLSLCTLIRIRGAIDTQVWMPFFGVMWWKRRHP